VREWKESINNNNCVDMAPHGYTTRDYVLDCNCVAWPQFAPCFRGADEADVVQFQVPLSPQHATEEHLEVHSFQGAVEPQALIEHFPKHHQESMIAASTVGILQRRAPLTLDDELNCAAEWVLGCLRRFHAQRCSSEQQAERPGAFLRTDSCSPKDGIEPGAGPYGCTLLDARRFVDACVTSRRVVQGLRSSTRSALRTCSAPAALPSANAQWADGSWQAYQKVPCHVEYPPAACNAGSSLVIQAWSPLVRPACEFRCFVRGNGVRAISQYFCYNRIPWLDGLHPAQKAALCRAVQLFQRHWLRPRLEAVGFMLPSYTMDVVVLPMQGRQASGSQPSDFALLSTSLPERASSAALQPADAFGVRLLELNPFGAHLSSGSALFNWRTDAAIMYGYAKAEGGTTQASDTVEGHCETPASCPVQLRWLTVCSAKLDAESK